jgi:signal transduction histidine kinase
MSFPRRTCATCRVPRLRGVQPAPSRPDVLVAAAFASWALVEVAVGISGQVSVDVVAGLLGTVPLAWRRAAPVTSALCCTGALALKTALGVENDGLALLAAALVAAYSVGRHCPPRRAAMVVPAMVVLGLVSLFGLSADQRTPSTYPFIALWLCAPAVAGAALRAQVGRAAHAADRAARVELLRDEHARAEVRAERDRIAREMHDTVAHAVSVMVLHAGAVRSRLPDELESERHALDESEQTGRRAVAELHRLLGLLRDGDGDLPTAPQPRLSDLETLVAESRAVGLEVEVRVAGSPPRSIEPAVEVSAYRIVQEALTNVRKHAGACRVVISLDFVDDQMHLRVEDDGAATSSAESAGFGLVGISERVAVYGGRVTAGPLVSGGFALEARLPIVLS